MGIGFLRINVFADNIAQPIEKAEIEITVDGRRYKLYTNADGQSERLELKCPDKDYSLTPQKNVKPYAVYDITVSKEGLKGEVVNGIQIFDGESSTQNVFLSSAPNIRQVEYINISDNQLWVPTAPKVVVDPDTMVSRERVLRKPVIPEYIIVHDGLPSNKYAPNYYVGYTDYIKNVASSEIYSTWPLETIRANVLAIQSFTLNRVFLEWYFSKGYDFTITSSTQFDQCYVHGRNIFESISNVVDDIFDRYINKRMGEQPFFAQYNDGIRVNNPGWLSQWGSKELGDKGYRAIDIIKYYYGDDKSITNAEIITGLPVSYPGHVLEVGSCSEAVQQIQLQLNKISAVFPGIPKILPPNGIYDDKTKNIVGVFQKVFDLPVTGKVDFATWYRISSVFIGVSNALESRFEDYLD